MFLTSDRIRDIQFLARTMTTEWPQQSDELDKKTNFIYNINSLIDLEPFLSNSNLSEAEKDYAKHRWFNFSVSKIYEELFQKYSAIPEVNEKSKEKDFWIQGIPYDLKVTQISPKFMSFNTKGSDAWKRDYILWLYHNQSIEQRFHLKNRLFFVVDGGTPRECLLTKTDITKSDGLISKFCENFAPKEFKISTDQSVFADLILSTDSDH